MSEKTITNDIQTNYISQVMLVKNAIPLMNQDSSIVLFGSSSYTRGRASYSIYSSTKAALVNFVQAVAEEIVDKGIRINIISPSRTNTPMRRRSFGKEDPKTLLNPDYVAKETIKVLISKFTGQVVDVTHKKQKLV